MHSSRMRTTRLLPVSPSMHCSGGVPAWCGGVYLPGAGGVPAWSGWCTCLVPGGVPGPVGGTCLVLGDVPGLGSVPVRVLPPPPWTEFLTHASENITLPQTSFAGGKFDTC